MPLERRPSRTAAAGDELLVDPVNEGRRPFLAPLHSLGPARRILRTRREHAGLSKCLAFLSSHGQKFDARTP